MSLAMDEFEEVRIILARGLHETLTLMEKQGKNPFLLGDTYHNLIKFTSEDSLKMMEALSEHFSDSLASFLEVINGEILNLNLN